MRVKGQYLPPLYSECVNKWWHIDQDLRDERFQTYARQHVPDHVARIMEMDLSEVQQDKCTSCADMGYECVINSLKGSKLVPHPGHACVRCRFAPTKCSLKPPPSPEGVRRKK